MSLHFKCRVCESTMRQCTCERAGCYRLECPGCGTVFDYRRQLWADYSRRAQPVAAAGTKDQGGVTAE